MNSSENLCSVKELNDRLGEARLSIIDASWYMPAQARDTRLEFANKHIPGAVYFDIDKICDPHSDLPHMLPSAADFSTAVSSMGISTNSDVVIYDSAGLFSAARVWWMFKVFGHQRVRVLDGGLPAWQDFGGQLSGSPQQPIKASYAAVLNERAVAHKQDLIENTRSARCLVLDARSQARFTGKAPEPRAGLSSGHMPESKSLAFDELIHLGRLRPKADLTKMLADRGVDKDTQLITSCGSGVTAAIITLALCEAGYGLQRLYDGAWSEWASADDTTILKGE